MLKALKNIKRLTPGRITRTILATLLLTTLLWNIVPVATIASGPMCTLACCAGRAPHAAGSCMTGSCHGVLAHNRKVHVHTEASSPTVLLCGLSRLPMSANRLPSRSRLAVLSDFGARAHSDLSRDASKTFPDQASIATAVLTKPCQPDCGSCGTTFTNSNRQRNAAALAYANRPRPPSSVRLGTVHDTPPRKLNALCRRGAPRGPPLSLS
jgi:hypothetical protein